jgi:hypothetical protein
VFNHPEVIVAPRGALRNYYWTAVEGTWRGDEGTGTFSAVGTLSRNP